MNVVEFDRAYLWRFRAQPIRAVDGDSLIVLADTGFNGRHEVNIRIADLNAPELDEPGGKDAANKLSLFINRHAFHPHEFPVSSWPLRVVTRQRERVVSEVRSFERYVADVFVVDDGEVRNILPMITMEAGG